MVVGGQTGFRQTCRLRIGEHSQRAADFHPQLRDAADHFQNIFKIIALLHLPPRCAHAEARRAFAARALCKFPRPRQPGAGRRELLRWSNRRSEDSRHNPLGTRRFLPKAGGKTGRDWDHEIRGAIAARRKADPAEVAGRSGEFLRESSHYARPSWLPNCRRDFPARALLREESRLACSLSRKHSSADSVGTPNSRWISWASRSSARKWWTRGGQFCRRSIYALKSDQESERVYRNHFAAVALCYR